MWRGIREVNRISSRITRISFSWTTERTWDMKREIIERDSSLPFRRIRKPTVDFSSFVDHFDALLSVPVVTIVVEGGPDTLTTIQSDLRQGIPIVLIDVSSSFSDTDRGRTVLRSCRAADECRISWRTFSLGLKRWSADLPKIPMLRVGKNRSTFKARRTLTSKSLAG